MISLQAEVENNPVHLMNIPQSVLNCWLLLVRLRVVGSPLFCLNGEKR